MNTKQQFPDIDAVGFLVWFHKEYGTETKDSFYKMAEKFGNGNSVTCRAKILKLVKTGHIIMTVSTRMNRLYQLNLEKYNELVNSVLVCSNINCSHRIVGGR